MRFFTFIFQYILPTIVAIGGIGNLINLVVLSSKDIKFTARGHRVSQRQELYKRDEQIATENGFGQLSLAEHTKLEDDFR